MKTNKLALNKETLKGLNPDVMAEIIGGGSGVTQYLSCNTRVNISCYSCVHICPSVAC